MDNLIADYTMNLTPQENGGEAVILHTEFYDNGDEELYTVQTLTLNSYGRSATITLGSIFTPEKLREIANKLETERIHAESRLTSR